MRAVTIAALGLLLLAPPAAARGPEAAVSRLPGVQAEVAIAVDPRDGVTLLAASNRSVVPLRLQSLALGLYSSTDGGASWSSALGPPRPDRGTCVGGDPAVGIDRDGRQFVAYIGLSPCSERGATGIFVSTRAGAADAWRSGADPVGGPLQHDQFDDKVALAVDLSPASPHPNRVYVAWTRLGGGIALDVLVVHSDDAGATWSAPVKVNDLGGGGTFVALATGRGGELYVAWQSRRGLRIDRSLDGGASFAADVVAARTGARLEGENERGGVCIPAQRVRCIRANPTLAVDSTEGPAAGRVYLTYSNRGYRGSQDVFLAAFDRGLRPASGFPAGRGRRIQAEGPAVVDQFQPVSALDAATGRLWICFYDTGADPGRRRAVFSCTASADGGATFARPVAAASVASDETGRGAYREFQFGDYQGLAVLNGVAHPIWTDSRDLPRLREEIYTTTLLDADLA